MTPYVGAIFAFGFNFAPSGWMLCQGQVLPISAYQALFSLIGTNFGGDGVSTFGLPNLQGRSPIGTGQGLGLPGYAIGQAGGNETITLTVSNLPPHSHVPTVSVPVTSANATNSVPANGNMFGAANFNAYATGASNAQMAASNGNTGITGSSIPVSILNPYTTINYCIAIDGMYPSRN